MFAISATVEQREILPENASYDHLPAGTQLTRATQISVSSFCPSGIYGDSIFVFVAFLSKLLFFLS